AGVSVRPCRRCCRRKLRRRPTAGTQSKQAQPSNAPPGELLEESLLRRGAVDVGNVRHCRESGLSPHLPAVKLALVRTIAGLVLVHSPLNSGFRFSPNALIPSLASWETKTRLIASRSRARPRSSGA